MALHSASFDNLDGKQGFGRRRAWCGRWRRDDAAADCDLVVAARSARLSLPFINLGLVPEAASTLLLPRAIGHLRAAELLLLSKPIDAETAPAMGLGQSRR